MMTKIYNDHDITIDYATVLGGAISPDGDVDYDRLPDADEWLSDGNSDLRVYRLPDAALIIESGVNNCVHVETAGVDMTDWLRDKWDNDLLDSAQILASFGLDGLDALMEAADDYARTCRIWISRHYYSGTLGAPIDGYASDNDNEPLEFGTAAEARTWIDDKETGTYYLAHGEYERPAYTIVVA